MGSSSSRAASPTTTTLPPAALPNQASTTEQSQRQPPQDDDKLRNGPCAQVFALLQKCQQEKGIRRSDRALTLCVSETDLLIKCIHRNPAYFKAQP